MYRIGTGRYYWKLNVTDSIGENNETETREFVVRPDVQEVYNGMSCSDVLDEAVEVYWGYDCGNPDYATCLGLNADLETQDDVSYFNVGSDCEIFFNTS